MQTNSLASIEIRALECGQKKFPQVNPELLKQAYFLSERSAETVHDWLMNHSYETFLEKYSIKISTDRSQISHLLLPLSQLQQGESFLMLPDSNYGLVHVFRENILHSATAIKIA